MHRSIRDRLTSQDSVCHLARQDVQKQCPSQNRQSFCIRDILQEAACSCWKPSTRIPIPWRLTRLSSKSTSWTHCLFIKRVDSTASNASPMRSPRLFQFSPLWHRRSFLNFCSFQSHLCDPSPIQLSSLISAKYDIAKGAIEGLVLDR